MRSGLARAERVRTITAVIALYAFVLHGFVAGLMPLPFPLHGGLPCLGQIDGDGPAPDGATPAHHPSCCTAPGIVANAEDPALVAAGIVWPRQSAIRIAWNAEPRKTARGPPGSIAHPRGPPTV